MATQHRKLKTILLTLGGNDFTEQVRSARTVNNTPDAERLPAYNAAGEVLEPADPEWVLELNLYSDWRSAGVSDYLSLNDGVDVAFVHRVIHAVGETVQRSGAVNVKAPSMGGEAKEEDMTEVTLLIAGVPAYTRI